MPSAWVPAPLPVQQRAAVGEVAIPIARVTTSIAKFVPVVGELVVLAEVATGRSIMGLGENSRTPSAPWTQLSWLRPMP
jgi:hypothetical protein